MPKRAKELSAVEVKRLSKPGCHAVGGVAGLLLRISAKDNGRSWILRTVTNGVRRDIGLGPYPEVTLAMARDKARELKEQIRQGRDPVAEKRARITFNEAAEKYLEGKLTELSNDKHAQQWRNSIKNYASPVIGTIPVDEIGIQHVVQVLEPIWHTKTETATRVRSRIEKVMNWAIIRGYRQADNPAVWKGRLDAVLPAPEKISKKQNFPSVPYREVPEFVEAVQGVDSISARALEWTILTAARSNETRGATWDEIDLDNAVWIIPKERMKASEEHRVPLTDEMIDVLERTPRFIDSPYVFPAPRGGQLSDATMRKTMRSLGRQEVVHGFRSSFRTWAAEQTNYDHAVIEKSMAHTISNAVERAYNRANFFEKRRRLMADWCRFCTGDAGQRVVIPFEG
jgi:integrase